MGCLPLSGSTRQGTTGAVAKRARNNSAPGMFRLSTGGFAMLAWPNPALSLLRWPNARLGFAGFGRNHRERFRGMEHRPARYAYEKLITVMDVMVGDRPLVQRLNTAHWELTQIDRHTTAEDSAELRGLIDKFLATVTSGEGTTAESSIESLKLETRVELAKDLRRMYYLATLAYHRVSD